MEVTLGSRSRATWAQRADAAGACIAVGLGTTKFPLLGRMPGWDGCSYGWHSDDGKRFHRSGVGSSFGPSYGPGDIVGIGVDYSSTVPHSVRAEHGPRPNKGRVFYTLNGRFVGYAFTDVDCTAPLWPLLGIDTPYPLTFNFGFVGQEDGTVIPQPFAFNVYELEKQLWARLARTRRRLSSAHRRSASGSLPDFSATFSGERTAAPPPSVAPCKRKCIVPSAVLASLRWSARLRRGLRRMHADLFSRPLHTSSAPPRALAASHVAFAPSYTAASVTTASYRSVGELCFQQWRLMDTEPVAMSDILLSWMLRRLRRERALADDTPGAAAVPAGMPAAAGAGNGGGAADSSFATIPAQQDDTNYDSDECPHTKRFELLPGERPTALLDLLRGISTKWVIDAAVASSHAAPPAERQSTFGSAFRLPSLLRSGLPGAQHGAAWGHRRSDGGGWGSGTLSRLLQPASAAVAATATAVAPVILGPATVLSGGTNVPTAAPALTERAASRLTISTSPTPGPAVMRLDSVRNGAHTPVDMMGPTVTEEEQDDDARSWWSEGSEHLNLLGGGAISIESEGVESDDELLVASARHGRSPPLRPLRAPHSQQRPAAAARLPTRLGLAHLLAGVQQEAVLVPEAPFVPSVPLQHPLQTGVVATSGDLAQLLRKPAVVWQPRH